MGTSCLDEPEVKESIADMKIKLKLKISDIEIKINNKNKEVEKCQNQAKFYLKNGNKFEARRQIKKKQFNQKIVEKYNTQIQILDEQLMTLENVEVNKDISNTIKSINAKIKEVNQNIDIRELEKAMDELNENKEKNKEINEEINEVMNQANEDIDDADLSKEIEKIEADMGLSFPKANTEKLDNDNANKQEIKKQEENLVFY